MTNEEFREKALVVHREHLRTCKYCIDSSLLDDSPEYEKHVWHEKECHICWLDFMDSVFYIDD